MTAAQKSLSCIPAFLLGISTSLVCISPVRAALRGNSSAAGAAQNQLAQQVGTIKSIQGNEVTMTTDRGAEIVVQVAANAKMVLVVPGEKDLKNATPIRLSDLRSGDRILVRGEASADGKSFTAIGIMAMSHSDLQARRQQENMAWQKGIAGLVKSVNPSNGTIVASVVEAGTTKSVTIQVTKNTIVRRYAPDSILFDDARPATIGDLKPGDQLRARGTPSADGNEFTADEIVSGTFRNIAGTILSTDATARTISVKDFVSKKPVTIRITEQSQLRILPPEVANRLAFQFKRAAAGAAAANTPNPSPSGTGPDQALHEPPRAAGAWRGRNRRDMQQLLNGIPPSALTDFHVGQAVLVVATEGSQAGEVTAITVLGGVEPILAAAPSSSQEMTLSPWNLGGSPAMGGDDNSQ